VCVLGLLVYASIGTLCAQTSVLDELKAQFNKDKGVPRLIVLVSPT
jgi:hypothetical protein